MGLDSLLCSILKTKRVRSLIKDIDVVDNIVTVTIEVPKEYRTVIKCLKEVAEGA